VWGYQRGEGEPIKTNLRKTFYLERNLLGGEFTLGGGLHYTKNLFLYGALKDIRQGRQNRVNSHSASRVLGELHGITFKKSSGRPKRAVSFSVPCLAPRFPPRGGILQGRDRKIERREGGMGCLRVWEWETPPPKKRDLHKKGKNRSETGHLDCFISGGGRLPGPLQKKKKEYLAKVCEKSGRGKKREKGRTPTLQRRVGEGVLWRGGKLHYKGRRPNPKREISNKKKR